MSRAPSPNGQPPPGGCRLLLVAVLCLWSLGMLALVGLVVQVIAGLAADPFLCGLAGAVAGWLSGLLTPRPRL